MATIGFNGGDKLEAVLRMIAKKAEKNTLVKVGFQNGATYPVDANAKNTNPVLAAQAAFWNEYGTSKIPSRPFFRTMIAAKSPKWGKNIAIQLKLNNYDAVKTMGIVGEAMVDQLRDSIINGSWQRNADSTIAKKGFDKPLQHTELMVRSVTREVEE